MIIFISVCILGASILLWLIISGIYSKNSSSKNTNLADCFEEPKLYECPPMQFTIQNTSNEERKCVLFGLARNFSKPNYGSDEGIKIIPDNGISYAECLFDSAFHPYRICKLRLHSFNENQLTTRIDRISSNATGQKLTDPLYPRFKDNQLLKNIIEEDTKFDFTVDTYWEFKINPNTTLIVTLFTEKNINIARYLNNQSACKEYSYPSPSIRPILVKNKL